MGTWHSSRVVVGPDNGGGHASSASWVGVKRMVMKVRMREGVVSEISRILMLF